MKSYDFRHAQKKHITVGDEVLQRNNKRNETIVGECTLKWVGP